MSQTPKNHRILLVDDNRAIHEDFGKIFSAGGAGANPADVAEAELFGDETEAGSDKRFEIDSAFQGEEALALVEKALAEGRPYAMAFVDVRMPPGWDGIETISRIWKVYPDLQVVICTAYSDYSWDEMIAKAGQSDRLLILKKPFDNVEALQLAYALTEKWHLLQQTRSQVSNLEERIAERTVELQTTNASLKVEVQERRRAESWLAAEKEILESLASNAALPDVLDLLARRIEGLNEGLLCSVLLLDADGIHLRHGAAPSLPAAYNKAIDGISIGPDIGSCGTAAFERRQVVVSDIGNDPLWKNFSELALSHELRACWSTPVLSLAGKVLGTFALYYREVREPSEVDLDLVRRATSLLSLALNRKRAEDESNAMDIQLRHAQKMESIGQLAAGIAHEINTPTQYIGDNTRFVQDAFGDVSALVTEYEKLLVATQAGNVTPELVSAVKAAADKADMPYLGEEVPKAIKQSLDGISRVTHIVRAMKEFSHPGTTEKTPVDLSKAIQSTITVASNEWKYLAELSTEFDPELPAVPCMAGEFNQVILNIVVNASHAIADVVGDGGKGKGSIRVSTRRDGDWAEVRIRDSGAGIPESARARIFDPFFTTKGVGKGTGQGLAIAHSVIVDKHGGTIHFETELGKGTTFIIRLPLAASSNSERKAA